MTNRSSKSQKATPTQSDKFKQAARDTEADQDEEAFKRRLKQVATRKASPATPKK
jgi:hypothetical protein